MRIEAMTVPSVSAEEHLRVLRRRQRPWNQPPDAPSADPGLLEAELVTDARWQGCPVSSGVKISPGTQPLDNGRWQSQVGRFLHVCQTAARAESEAKADGGGVKDECVGPHSSTIGGKGQRGDLVEESVDVLQFEQGKVGVDDE